MRMRYPASIAVRSRNGTFGVVVVIGFFPSFLKEKDSIEQVLAVIANNICDKHILHLAKEGIIKHHLHFGDSYY